MEVGNLHIVRVESGFFFFCERDLLWASLCVVIKMKVGSFESLLLCNVMILHLMVADTIYYRKISKNDSPE
jgi:hypothetical protein